MLGQEKNDALGLDLNKSTCGSNKKAYFRCENCGISYERIISNKGKSLFSLCKKCSAKRRRHEQIQKQLNYKGSIIDSHPYLLQEWDYEENNKLSIYPTHITAGSGIKIHWMCNVCGFKWLASMYSRKEGSGCPQCTKEAKTSFSEQAIFYYIRRHFLDTINGYKDENISEIDIFIPSLNIGIEYDGERWHSSKSSKIRDGNKDNVLKDKGITLIRIKEMKKEQKYSNAYVKDNIIYHDHRNKKNLNKVIQTLLSRFLGIVDKTVNVELNRILIMEQYISTKKKNSLAVNYPDIAKEWNYEKNGKLKPEFISYGSEKKVWWKCEKGHNYESTVNNRTSGHGCPYCKGKKVLEGFNDLNTIMPELAEKINNNSIVRNVSKGSKKKVSVICNMCGQQFYTRISDLCKSFEKHQKILCHACSLKKQIVNLDTNKVFDGINSASIYYKIPRSSISHCLASNRKTAGGYHWSYYDEYKITE